MVLKTHAGQETAVDAGDLTIEIPENVQSASDAVMDYLADNALRPSTKLCGSPLTVLSGLMHDIQNALPVDMQSDGKTMMAFISRQITHFCREKNVNHLTLSFDFKRG